MKKKLGPKQKDLIILEDSLRDSENQYTGFIGVERWDKNHVLVEAVGDIVRRSAHPSGIFLTIDQLEVLAKGLLTIAKTYRKNKYYD